MKLKDKKITQCSYIGSNGTKYNLGYGNNLSPEISLKTAWSIMRDKNI